MKIRLASPCNIDSIVDGPGLRIVVWTQGCPHHCKGCFNTEMWDYNGGKEGTKSYVAYKTYNKLIKTKKDDFKITLNYNKTINKSNIIYYFVINKN